MEIPPFFFACQLLHYDTVWVLGDQKEDTEAEGFILFRSVAARYGSRGKVMDVYSVSKVPSFLFVCDSKYGG